MRFLVRALMVAAVPDTTARCRRRRRGKRRGRLPNEQYGYDRIGLGKARRISGFEREVSLWKRKRMLTSQEIVTRKEE